MRRKGEGGKESAGADALSIATIRKCLLNEGEPNRKRKERKQKGERNAKVIERKKTERGTY